MIDIGELLYAYSKGYFPMAVPEEENQLFWFKPEMRGIIPIDQFKVSKNVARLYRQKKYDLHIDKDFEQTIRHCSDREETWISEEIIDLYVRLHKLGYAHSFEVWKGAEQVGGLYGVKMGKAFFGESMFNKESDTSKLALVYLVDFLKKYEFTLLDTQYLNPFLVQFGAIEIPEKAYDVLLSKALESASMQFF